VVGILTDLAILAEAASIGPPATLVVGDVAALGIAAGRMDLPAEVAVSRGRPPARRRSRP
jgi:hypothetical protein